MELSKALPTIAGTKAPKNFMDVVKNLSLSFQIHVIIALISSRSSGGFLIFLTFCAHDVTRGGGVRYFWRKKSNVFHALLLFLSCVRMIIPSLLGPEGGNRRLGLEHLMFSIRPPEEFYSILQTLMQKLIKIAIRGQAKSNRVNVM